MNVRALVCLALIHTLVDGYAQLVTPLWPQLTKELALTPWALTMTFATWQMATSISQPLFGYWGDRHGSRWLVGLGPALAIVCLSLLGWAGNATLLAGLLALGGLGIGAFHPEAAVGVVEAARPRITQGLAVFVFGGMLGLGLGPVLSGTLTERYGLHSLAWVMLPGLVVLSLLLWLRPPGHHHLQGSQPGVGLGEMLRGRWLPASLLLAVSTLRAVPVIGIPLALAFWLDQQAVSESGIGRVQSIFLLSGGVGTLLCPMLIRPGKEIGGLIATVFPAALCVALLTVKHPVAFYGGLAASGLLLQGGIPLLIAYSQRLLPRGRRLAASLILGSSWGLAGLIIAGLQAYFSRTGHFEALVLAMVPFTLLAGIGSFLLPRGALEAAKEKSPRHQERPIEPAAPGATLIR